MMLPPTPRHLLVCKLCNHDRMSHKQNIASGETPAKCWVRDCRCGQFTADSRRFKYERWLNRKREEMKAVNFAMLYGNHGNTIS